ncbi:MAG TPA: hypothetical protein VFY05_05695 [Candidatus Angelobacter sp.]|nr:hypothetical protein [Candidatus Angelobacter sp.]
MPFKPDILVTEPDSCRALLIVETKLIHDRGASDAQLKRYMWQMSCPLGIVATPRNLFIYRNRFTAYSDDSVEQIGNFAAPSEWIEFEARGSGSEFEVAVQRWLELLRVSPESAHLSWETRQGLSESIFPTLVAGQIQAAGPRLRT